jgi:putative endonuclease
VVGVRDRHHAPDIGTLSPAAWPRYGGTVNAHQQYGRAAEEAAARYLVRAGWRLLGRNVRVGRGELDIVARRGPVLAFVEVKARRTHTCGTPEDAVGARKRQQVARLAQLWLAARPWALNGIDDVRFDIIAVDSTVFPSSIRHLAAAFTLDR